MSCIKNQRADTIRASLVTLTAARDGFTAWDRTHQESIIRGASTLEEGRAELDRYRERRRHIVESFVVAYQAIAVAATQSDETSLKAAVRASEDLLAAIKALISGGT